MPGGGYPPLKKGMPASMSNPKRFSLLLYGEWMRPMAVPAFCIMAILFVLWAISLLGMLPEHLGGSRPVQDILLGAAAIATFLLWGIVVILPRLSYVECRSDYLVMRIGFLRLIVSYSRVRTTRSVLHGQIHSPKTQPRSRRALAIRMAPWQSVAIELTSYPMAFFLLRAMTHPFLFLGDQPGFLFAVEDWMGLDQSIEEARAAWIAKRKTSDKPPRLWGLLE
jgi:hypothetical protein